MEVAYKIPPKDQYLEMHFKHPFEKYSICEQMQQQLEYK